MTREGKPPFIAGNPISAGWLNDVDQARGAIAGITVGPGLELRRTLTGVHITLTHNDDPVVPRLRKFKIEDALLHPDTLVCSPVGDPVGRVHVAKPYLLRAFPFVISGRGVIAYEYTTPIERVATKGEGDEVQEENQTIVPEYMVGDVIYAMKAVINGSDEYRDTLVDVGPDAGLFAEWIDMNIDGRFWAKSAATEEEA